MGVVDLQAPIASIGANCQRLGLTRLQRAHRRNGDELIPTGEVRWQILDAEQLKRYLLKSVGRERAIAIGSEVAAVDEELKYHRMVELMRADELLAMSEVLEDA